MKHWFINIYLLNRIVLRDKPKRGNVFPIISFIVSCFVLFILHRSGIQSYVSVFLENDNYYLVCTFVLMVLLAVVLPYLTDPKLEKEAELAVAKHQRKLWFWLGNIVLWVFQLVIVYAWALS